MPLSNHLVSRRTTLAAAPLLVVAGCRWGPEEEQATPTESDSPAPAPDAVQVTAAREAIAEAQTLVMAVRTEHPSLAKPLAGLLALHQAHLKLLSTDEDGTTTTLQEIPVGGEALVEVLRTERALQAKLARLAGVVSSGELARILASMAAAVAQELQRLPRPKKGAGQ